MSTQDLERIKDRNVKKGEEEKRKRRSNTRMRRFKKEPKGIEEEDGRKKLRKYRIRCPRRFRVIYRERRNEEVQNTENGLQKERKIPKPKKVRNNMLT